MSPDQSDPPHQPATLDVFACPFDGVSFIEASAGTGKTWNICALYLRLLLEAKLEVDAILVVTFTEAATAELRERIRSRLVELVYALTAGDHPAAAADSEATGDPFIARALAAIDAVGAASDCAYQAAREQARLRLERAIYGFDQAAIHTIHGFCQRALKEAPFAAGLPFEFKLDPDDEALRFELAVQFWRRHVEPAAAHDARFAAWLVQQRLGPAALDASLQQRLKKPLAELRWPEPSAPEAAATDDIGSNGPGWQTFDQLFSQARMLWQAQREAVCALLEAARGQLHQGYYTDASIAAACNGWDRYLAVGDPAAAPNELDKQAELLSAARLIKNTKKHGTPPFHPFFEAAEALLANLAQVRHTHAARWRQLLRAWLTWAPDALAKTKRARRVASFDDLLGNLHRALNCYPWLAHTVRRRYPAALIDEFQDTDPLQFAIFERIYLHPVPQDASANGNQNGLSNRSACPSLFLVGDPKQAIYSFRAADLYTYLAARQRANAHYTLTANQRSTAPLITAINRIFTANPAAFVLDGLRYQPACAGDRPRARWLAPATGTTSAPAAALHVWLAPSDPPCAKRDLERRAVQSCAAEIVRLLRSARIGEATDPCHGTPLAPHEIAVLVSTHRQAGLVKQGLTEWGIGSVERANQSVFASADAEQIERVLLAIDAPSDLRKLRAALAVDWFGLDAHALAQLDAVDKANSGARLDAPSAPSAGIAQDAPPSRTANESKQGENSAAGAASWLERFARYRALWHARGFAPMWQTLLGELRIAQRIVAGPNGERRITDLAHLAELISEHAMQQSGSTPVLRWLSAQRASAATKTPASGDATQLRLESDRNLVQIITVHRSKGMEYAVVFCPFLNDGQLRAPSTALSAACEYHASDGRPLLDYRYDESTGPAALQTAKIEQAAERVRLIYVALTRAVYRCYLVAGPYAIGSSASTCEARSSVLNWLVAGAGRDFTDWLARPPTDAVIANTWHTLADGATIAVEPLPPAANPQRYDAGCHCVPLVGARAPQRTLANNRQIASFSSLVAVEPRDPLHDTRPDGAAVLPAPPDVRPDHDAVSDPSADLPDGNSPLDPCDIVAFPRGAAAGECLHRMFELADFTDRASWRPAIARALRERPIAPRDRNRFRSAESTSAEIAARLSVMMERALADVVATELLPGFSLAEVPLERRRAELAFIFPASCKQPALHDTLAEFGYTGSRWDSQALSLHGYLKGFIDLVCEHRGRYYLVDWKSNHLGNTPDDYAAAPLAAAMASHAYPLQALIYTVALHRHLRRHVANYDYATHFGGALYLFIRGVRPAWRGGPAPGTPAGVHVERPAPACIAALDALMK